MFSPALQIDKELDLATEAYLEGEDALRIDLAEWEEEEEEEEREREERRKRKRQKKKVSRPEFPRLLQQIRTVLRMGPGREKNRFGPPGFLMLGPGSKN